MSDVNSIVRMPNVVNLVDGNLCLNLGKRIPVAIVIVAHILVIKLRWICSLVGRAERLVVPVFDNIYAIGI